MSVQPDLATSENQQPTDTTPPVGDGEPGETSSPSGVEVDPGAELKLVDPGSLVVDRNTRTSIMLGAEFLASIRDHGVRAPIIVRRREDDGALVIRQGHRRARAAVEVGLERVRVLIEPGPIGGAAPHTDVTTSDGGDAETGKRRRRRGKAISDDEQASIDRIIDQLDENNQRASITDADEIGAHQELLDLGLTVNQIAARTHTPRKRVVATTRVARSELAAAALARYDLTIDQADVLADFDDDRDAVTELIATIKTQPDRFGHVAQRMRDERTEKRLCRERTAELIGAGVRVFTDDDTPPSPDTSADPDTASNTVAETVAVLPSGAERITGLRPAADSPSGTPLALEDHASCPGHAATVRAHRRFGTGPEVAVTYWCTDPTAHGHAPRFDSSRPGSSRTAATNADTASAAAALEEARQERRTVIANNKAWVSATAVRREWLQNFLRRKTPPRDALRYVVASLAAAPHDLRKAMEAGHPTACELQGMDPVGSVYGGRPNPIATAAATASSAKLTMQALAIVLGAAEDGTHRNSWRNPTGTNRAYFTALAGWGYPLSEVEQLVIPEQAGENAPDGEDTDGSQNESGEAEPPADEPEDVEPDSAEPTNVEPTVVEPDAIEPDEPVLAEPDVDAADEGTGFGTSAGESAAA